MATLGRVILENGRVRTGDPRLPLARAIAIAGERIGGGVDVREGDRSRVSSERVDLDGRCVVPGLHDAHVHFLEWSLALGTARLSATRSHAEVLAAAAGAAAAATAGCSAPGWRAARWPAGDPAPHREALDAACGGRPVLLWAHDHHTAWLSSARSRCCRSATAPVVERDAAGEPTGVLRETRRLGRRRRHPAAERARARRGASRAGCARPTRAASPASTTSSASAASPPGSGCTPTARLTLRVWASLPAERLDEIVALGLRSGLGDEWLRIGPVKAFADGTLGSRTASMLEPFADAGRGEALLSAEELRDLAAAAPTAASTSRCTRSATPPTAPSSTRSRRRASAGRRAACGRASSTRSCSTPTTCARFAALGVTASMQPSHAPTDRPVARGRLGRALRRRLRARLAGRERRAAVLRLRRADRAARPAGRRAGGRDARLAGLPRRSAVELALDGFWAAPRARATPSGVRPAGAGLRGRLVVLERDPVTCPPDEIAAHRRRRDDGGRPLGARAPPW